MSCIPYQKMAISDLWTIRFKKTTYSNGERNSLEVLLFHPESINQIAIGIIQEDLNFYEFFDLDKEATQRVTEKAFEDYFIAQYIVNFAEEFFDLIGKAIRGGKLDSSSTVGGQGDVRPVEFLEWLPKKQYYVPSGLIKALETGSVEEAEYLLKAFRQGLLYQFICECSGQTKKESCEELHKDMKGFIANGGVVAQTEGESAEISPEPEQPGGVDRSEAGAKPKKDWENIKVRVLELWEESERRIKGPGIAKSEGLWKVIGEGEWPGKEMSANVFQLNVGVNLKYTTTKINQWIKDEKKKSARSLAPAKGRKLKVTKK